MNRLSQIACLLVLAISGNSTAGTAFDLTEFRGKVVVVDFWASWCVPCRRSFPWMNSMQEKYGNVGLVFIGVNVDADPAEANAFLQDYPANFRIINDSGGELARDYEVIAMPSSYVFDRNGEPVTRHLGFEVRRQAEYEEILVESLGKDMEGR